ncbi:MAG: phage tail protein [Deltaproteobacteria bacterium]|nr:phage tail protein [Deltaproteobacteria bacterium]
MPETGNRSDPFLGFRFEVRLDDLSVGGFSECTGMQVETEVHDYPEGGLNTHVRKFVTRTKQSNITLKRGIVDRVLWDWHFDIARGEMHFRNGAIIVRDPSGSRVTMEWHFRQAFPCKWVGPELNAAQNNVAIETLELCHQGLERRH